MKRGFTLIELVAVLAMISLLVFISCVHVAQAYQRSRAVDCITNLRNLISANTQYGIDTKYYVAAAEDIMSSNNKRWHGTRLNGVKDFDSTKGPLSLYLGNEGKIRACVEFQKNKQYRKGFESGNGGYGYNAIGVGSRSYISGYNGTSFAKGMKIGSIEYPSHVLMFGDAAFPQPYGKSSYLIEYSFIEPVYHLKWGSTEEGVLADPSLHFRHSDRVNVGWCDGRISSEKRAITFKKGIPAIDNSSKFDIGWFNEPPTNKPFNPF